MIRPMLLTLVIVSAASVTPFGCPPAESPVEDVTPAIRTTMDVSASASSLVTVGKAVTLAATATADSAGGPISYAWLQTAGPGVSIAGADKASASFTAPSLQTLQTLAFVVTTHNDAGAAGRAEVRVKVSADPNYAPYFFGPDVGAGGSIGATGPLANAGPDLTVLPGDSVTLDGTSSSGRSLKYQWQQVSGTAAQLSGADSAKTTFTVPDFVDGGDNALVFRLNVTDTDDRTVNDLVTITVRDPNAPAPRVQIATTMGNFVIELDANAAPLSTANFLQYVDASFYDGTIFHRVIAGFVIQGGGFEPGLKEKPTRDPIKNESSNGLKNVRGSVAMARTNDPDSATSQWYVNLVDNSFLDPSADNPGYAVFGQVVEGMDVVDRIATVQTGERLGFQDVPVTDVIVRTAKRQ